jgi:cholesterol transport system auxiliary component
MSHPIAALVRSRRGFLLSTASLVLLGGCGLVGPVPERLYRLEPPPRAASGLPAVRWRLAVSLPLAAEALDTDRVALGRPEAGFDYFADAAWTDRVPPLVEGLLIRRFEDSGRILAVSRDTDSLASDYLLETEIHDFQADYPSPSGPPTIALRLTARLIRMPSREIIAVREVGQRVPVQRNEIEAIIAGFAVAAEAALDQIVDWTLAAPV